MGKARCKNRCSSAPCTSWDRAFPFRESGHPNGYYLSEVIHAAKLQVNEKGTEAAAATLVAAGDGAAPPPAEGIKLLLDRPFLYGIFDRQNGIPLFLGTFE